MTRAFAAEIIDALFGVSTPTTSASASNKPDGIIVKELLRGEHLQGDHYGIWNMESGPS